MTDQDDEKLQRIFAAMRGDGPDEKKAAELHRKWPSMVDAAFAEAQRRDRAAKIRKLLLGTLALAAVLLVALAIRSQLPAKVRELPLPSGPTVGLDFVPRATDLTRPEVLDDLYAEMRPDPSTRDTLSALSSTARTELGTARTGEDIMRIHSTLRTSFKERLRPEQRALLEKFLSERSR